MTEQESNETIGEGEKKYRRGEVIGVGGFGLVYEAYDFKNDQKVVIKVLKRKSKEETFKKEINIMKQIQHDSVVTLLDTFRSQDNFFCAVMNYAENGSILSDIIRNGPYSEDKMKGYMKSILEGLDSVHKQGIIHNDIKAANILLNKGKALIADFGASIDTKVTKNLRTSIGSPHWMSPETASGQPVSVKSDIWSIGILAIEMLTGKPPLSNFPGSTVLLILKETKRVPISLKVSDICLSFIKMCLQSNPKYRPDASDLLYHPFFMDTSNSNNGIQKSSFFIDLANQITKEVHLCSQILNENKEKIFCSLKNLNEINDRFILLEIVALFSKENSIKFISPIIEHLLKSDADQISSDEIIKIILMFLRNVDDKSETLSKFDLFSYLSEESVKENPLVYIIQEQLKLDDKKIINIDDTISFLSNYHYDYIYNKLIKIWQFVQIPRRLRLLLNEKMHEITSDSFTAALRMINSFQLDQTQIKCFCHFFDITTIKNFTKENFYQILNILVKSPLDTLGYHQQNIASSFIINYCISQNMYVQNDDEMLHKIIENTVSILEQLTKINISSVLEKNSEFWKVLYKNHMLKAISSFASKCSNEFDKNIDIELTLKMIKHSIESRQYGDFEFYNCMFKNSTKLCSSFVTSPLFMVFCKTLFQVLPAYLDNYLQIIQELISTPKKPNNFYICLRGPLTRISIFNHNQNAALLLKMLNKEQIQ